MYSRIRKSAKRTTSWPLTSRLDFGPGKGGNPFGGGPSRTREIRLAVLIYSSTSGAGSGRTAFRDILRDIFGEIFSSQRRRGYDRGLAARQKEAGREPGDAAPDPEIHA